MNYAVSNWSAKNARKPDGLPLNAEEVLQGVINPTQNALQVVPVATSPEAVRAAFDYAAHYNYESAVLGGNRITSIVESSASLGLSFTTTFTYVSGTDDIEDESIAETP